MSPAQLPKANLMPVATKEQLWGQGRVGVAGSVQESDVGSDVSSLSSVTLGKISKPLFPYETVTLDPPHSARCED